MSGLMDNFVVALKSVTTGMQGLSGSELHEALSTKIEQKIHETDMNNIQVPTISASIDRAQSNDRSV